MQHQFMYNIPYTELKSQSTRIYIPVVIHYCECHGVNALETGMPDKVRNDIKDFESFYKNLAKASIGIIDKLPSKSFINQNGELCLQN